MRGQAFPVYKDCIIIVKCQRGDKKTGANKMTRDPIEEARRTLTEAAPEASKVFLKHYVGEGELTVPELVLKATQKLPSTGPISRKKDDIAIKAISYLLDDVDESDPRKEEAKRLFDSAYSRRITKT